MKNKLKIIDIIEAYTVVAPTFIHTLIIIMLLLTFHIIGYLVGDTIFPEMDSWYIVKGFIISVIITFFCGIILILAYTIKDIIKYVFFALYNELSKLKNVKIYIKNKENIESQIRDKIYNTFDNISNITIDKFKVIISSASEENTYWIDYVLNGKSVDDISIFADYEMRVKDVKFNKSSDIVITLEEK